MVGGEGLMVYDAFQKSSRRIWFDLLYLVEDSRGLKNPAGCKQAPAYVGGCPFCEIIGIRHCGTEVYMGAVAECKDEVLKQAFEKEFRQHQGIAALARKTVPLMTAAKATVSANKVENLGYPKEDQAFKEISAYHTFMRDDWDFIKYANA